MWCEVLSKYRLREQFKFIFYIVIIENNGSYSYLDQNILRNLRSGWHNSELTSLVGLLTKFIGVT